MAHSVLYRDDSLGMGCLSSTGSEEQEAMNITTIDAMSLPEAWWMCLRKALEEGWTYTIDRGSFEGHQRKELDMVVINVEVPSMRPIVPTVPPGVPQPTTIEFVNDYLPYLMSDAKTPDEEYTYGWYLASQIQGVIQMLKDTPNTNQAYMTVGDPSTMLMKDPPCLRGIQCRVRYGKLHFVVYFRSWDLWAGLPSNLAALQLMKESMASDLGLEDGTLNAVSPGLHLYDHSWEFARMVLKEAS